jgi:hypothetical protein
VPETRRVLSDLERGSEKLIRESLQKPIIYLDEHDFQRFTHLTQQQGIEFLDWTTKGTPTPDVLHGVMQVRPDALQRVFKHFTSLNKRYWHDYFPIWVPDIDRILLRFGNYQQLR